MSLEPAVTDPQDSHPTESGPRGFVNWKPLVAFLGRYGFMIALLLPAIILLATNETFRNPLNLSNILAQSSMVGVAAVGMTVVMILGGFDLSIGAIAAVTGLVAVLIFGTGDPLFLALGCLACIGTGALIGAFNGTLISRIGINPLIATLAMASLVRGLVLITSEGTIHRAEGDAMWITTLALGRVGGGFPIAGFFFIGAVVMGSIILRYSKFGRWVYAIGGNEEAARLSGVPVSRVVITCYALMGGLAGLAGLLFTSRTGTALTTTGIGLEIDAITATVIGGTRLGGGHGAILGTVVGVILLGVIRNGLNLNGVSPFWQPFIIGCNRLFAEMEKDALRDLAASAIPTDDVQFQWFYDAAYWGQAHELIVPLAKGRFEDVSDLRRAFDDEHERIYTFKMEGDRVNFLHWRVNAAVGSSMPMPRRSASASEDPSAALTGHRTAYFGGKDGATEVPVYDGMQLEPGHVVRGAAVIEDAARRHAGSFRHVALRSVDRDLRQYRRGGDHRCRLQGIRNGRPPARDRRRCAGRIDL